jgi:hypothetical protein
METIFILVGLGLAAFLVWRLFPRKNPHSPAKMLRFAATSAREILASNWDHEEYYGRMYKYASQELASQMFKNKLRLDRALDEREGLLGNFVDLQDLNLGGQGFSLVPSQVFEVTGTLVCHRAKVPVIILVNAGKQDLSLDGIRIIKESARQSGPAGQSDSPGQR